jgi:hypothetical protein
MPAALNNQSYFSSYGLCIAKQAATSYRCPTASLMPFFLAIRGSYLHIGRRVETDYGGIVGEDSFSRHWHDNIQHLLPYSTVSSHELRRQVRNPRTDRYQAFPNRRCLPMPGDWHPAVYIPNLFFTSCSLPSFRVCLHPLYSAPAIPTGSQTAQLQNGFNLSSTSSAALPSITPKSSCLIQPLIE